MIKGITEIALLILSVFILSAAIYACSCPTVGQSVAEAKAYYAEKFDGAVFTGSVTAVRDVPSTKTREDSFSQRELDIEIDQYWIGIDKPSIKAYTIGPNTSCTVNWEIGKTRFFIARRDKINKKDLRVGMCDLSNWRGRYPSKEWEDYTNEILGPPKSFLKRQSLFLNEGFSILNSIR